MKIKRLGITVRKLLNRKYALGLTAIILISLLIYFTYSQIISLKRKDAALTLERNNNFEQLTRIRKELEKLKNEDQYLRNEKLQEEIENIHSTYSMAVLVYEDLVKLKEKSKDTAELDVLFASALTDLSDKNYAGASITLGRLKDEIEKEEEKISAAGVQIPANIPESNAPPGSGYSRQRVKTNAGVFLVSMIAADIGSTRVIVDTASDSDCSTECPVLPLSEYVSRNGAYAGVNGSYFCPAEYPSCAGKTNSFDLLLMNHKKTYFNSGNNVYSNNPAVIFGEGYVRFVISASEWGRDTSPNGVLSNYPILVFNKEIKFGGDDDPKKGSRGGRSFVATKDNNVYIGVVHSATVAESARVMSALGMENAMNLDNGGSTALWSGGYKVGPGRNLPNVILFVRK